MRKTTRLLSALAGASAFALAACGENDAADTDEAGAPPSATAETAQAAAPAPAATPALRPPAAVNRTRIINADEEPGAWMSHARTYDEQRYSPLDQINAENVSNLSLAWYVDVDTTRGMEATPIVVDGVMYATSPWSIVHAVNAVTGETLWTFDPEVPRAWGVYACCDVVNRGVAVREGKVFVGTIDGRLIALDAATGDEVWSVDTINSTPPYTITGAPRVVNGKVIIGNGGAEYGVRGYVTAYDAETGEEAWRFYTVPGNPADGFENAAMEAAAETWNGQWWEYGGGGTVWDSMAYDPDLNLLYIGVGNGSPWNREIRSPGGGDNLYLSSIVALNPDTGEYVWHYQTTPGETWDYTATQHIMLADLDFEGEQRRVVMQAPKNGFFYVLDAATGEFISANNYVPVNWASGIDPETGRPIEIEASRYLESPFQAIPGPLGGHNWQPMAFSQQTNLVYIPAHQVPFDYAGAGEIDFDARRWNLGLDLMAVPVPSPDALEAAIRAALQGHLVAWDPVAQEEAWSVDLHGPWNGGVLATGGDLVFQGTARAEFKAYDAATGDELWSYPTQTGVIAAPMSYEIDGVQYVTVLAGYGGAFPLTTAGNLVDPAARPNTSRILTFALNGEAGLPEFEIAEAPLPEPPALGAGEDVILAGGTSYQYSCSVCHGVFAWSGGQVRDLRMSSALGDAETWKAIVHDGAMAASGMAPFEGFLTEDEVEAIRQYVIFEATNAYAAQQADAQ